MSNIDRLKNALLTYALIVVKPEDFDDVPQPSGISTTSACFRYIVDPSDDVSKKMEERQKAIEHYLDTHFDTDEKLLEFFNQFLEKIKL